MNNNLKLQVKKLNPDAKLPVRSTNHAAAYDLYALEDGTIYPSKIDYDAHIIATGVAIKIPNNLPEPFRVYGSIRSRSGLSAKHRLEVGAGVIDSDYSHEIKVIIYNHGKDVFKYKKHDRIAQLILEVHITPDILKVDDLDVLENNNRMGGFGSTGR